MKLQASAPTLPVTVPVGKGWVSIYSDLFKARLTSLVLLTTMLGVYLASGKTVDFWLMFHAVFGMGLVASGGAALNQLIERELDARMRRTAGRPLPSGLLEPRTVFWVGLGCGALGLGYLAVTVNLLSAALAGFTLMTYLLVYTPLKRVTWLNTLVGAIPGAMPPLIGWTAARDQINGGGLALFAIQALWQIPHFMAICWIYRDEYRRAGFHMLSGIDPSGRRTSRQAVGYALALLVVSLVPWAMSLAGTLYLLGAVALGLTFVVFSIRFYLDLTVSRARELFFVSILYLPLLLSTMVLGKTA